MNPQDPFSFCSATGPAPPQAQSRVTSSELPSSVSRKSARRGEESMVHIDVPRRTTTRALQVPPPLTHLDGASNSATVVSTSLSPVALLSNWSGWGASLPPRGYTASQRNFVEVPLCDDSQLHSEQASHQRGEDNVVVGLGQPSATSAPLDSTHRWKRRRTEHVGFAELQKEVFMYLDTVASTQEQLPDHGRCAGHAEEDEGVFFDRSATTPFHGAPLRNATASCASSQGAEKDNDCSTSPASEASVLRISLDSAVHDTIRVLQQCWEYRGAPHDAFEPVRLLSPITLHLLLTYGRHSVTPDGQHVVLCGGAEHLPWVGCLYSILLTYLYRHCATSAITGATGNGERGANVAPVSEGVSRMLLLNCHSFGWMDHIGSGEYEKSHRRLYQARDALVGLLEDPRYAAFGRPAGCPLCASSLGRGDASTLVLLGDTIVMEGGAPSLGLANPRDTFTAHYQYGRGIACCVPEMGGGFRLDVACSGPVGTGPTGHTPAPGTGLCAAHRRPPGPAAMSSRLVKRLDPNLHPPHQHHATTSDGRQVEEEIPTLMSSNRQSDNGRWFSANNSFPCVTNAPAASFRLPAVCCGVCRAVGVIGQAVLLGSTGPLVIHLQFDEREWLHRGSQVVPVTTADHWLTAANVDSTVACPSPLSHLASNYADERAVRVGELLYAIMQREATAGFGGHCGNSPPIGGSVSLAEFVEWLARFLHAPPPALVVEWHSSSFSLTSTPASSPSVFQHVKSSHALNPGGTGDLPVSCSSSCSPMTQQHSPSAQFRFSVAASSHSLNSRLATLGSNSLSRPTCVGSSDEDHGTASWSTDSKQDDGSPNKAPFPHGIPTSSIPLGMLTEPRHPTVSQLFEVYRDVLQSHADVLAAPAATSLTSSVGISRAFPFPDARGTSGNPVEAMQPHVLLDWLQVAQQSLRRCEAAYFFDGAERPLVLAKDLEVVAEAERFLDASSVATSLQFRPCSVRL